MLNKPSKPHQYILYKTKWIKPETVKAVSDIKYPQIVLLSTRKLYLAKLSKLIKREVPVEEPEKREG